MLCGIGFAEKCGLGLVSNGTVTNGVEVEVVRRRGLSHVASDDFFT